MDVGATMAEKILARACGKEKVTPGEIIYPFPDLITVHDWYITHAIKTLEELGVERIWDPSRVIVSTDHEVIATSVQAAERQKAARKIAEKYNISRFFDVGFGGLGHVFPVEKGFVEPGMFVLAYDTHVTNFGAVGALGIPVITEIAAVLALGTVWIQVPKTIRINLKGRLKPGVSIRDFSQWILGRISEDVFDYAIVEYGGEAFRHLGIDARHTLCNIPIEMGAKSALVEPDDFAKQYLKTRPNPVRLDWLVMPDPDAEYAEVYEFDLSEVEPQVAAPPRPDHVFPVSRCAGTKIDHAFIGSCASGLLEDLREAARILKNRTLHPGVRLFVTPATQEIMRSAEEEGIIKIFVEAGAVITPPGCGPCAGGKIGGLAAGEVSINTGTRNDPGRLGAYDAQIYLASPATVAASAIRGKITDPREFFNEGEAADEMGL